MFEAERRIERFARLGGVDLRGVRPADEPLVVEVHAGVAPLKRAVFIFRCPVCGNTVRNDQEMEPACTGPSWTDDHPLEPMVLVT